MQKSEFWQNLEGDETYDDVKFRKTCSDALQVVERYLSSESYFSNQLMEASNRLKALSKKEFSPIYKSHFRRVKKLLERFPERGPEYYFYQYKVEQTAFEVRQNKLKRFTVTNLDDIINNLDCFYVLEKLKYYCEVLSRRSFIKHEYQKRLIDEILVLIKEGHFENVPLIKIYYQVILTYLHPTDNGHYYLLKVLLRESAQLLPLDILQEVYTAAINYSNRKINQGHNDFIIESFETYIELIDRELIFDENHLSHWTFKNVIVLGLRLGKYDWAAWFIDNYGQYIREEFRESAVRFSRAQLYFYQGKHEKVLGELHSIEYEDVSYNLGVKSMQLATYYEMNEWEAFYSLAESFKVFIHRKKNLIPEARRKSYGNLIKYIKRLQKILPYEEVKLKKLLKQVTDSSEEISSVDWIKEQIRQKMAQKTTTSEAYAR